MFYRVWFASDTFSVSDALLKLILVIVGSALIICFCHKVTNYKKSRYYKPHQTTFNRQTAATNHQLNVNPPFDLHQAAAIYNNNNINQQGARFITTANCYYPAVVPVDPYGRSIASFVGGPGGTNNSERGHFGHLTAYTNQANSNNIAPIESLASLGASSERATNLVLNPVFSTSSGSYPTPNYETTGQDACPSYEEAIQQQQQQQQAPTSQRQICEPEPESTPMSPESATSQVQEGLPLKLVVDYPTFAETLIGFHNAHLDHEMGKFYTLHSQIVDPNLGRLFPPPKSGGSSMSSDDEDDLPAAIVSSAGKGALDFDINDDLEVNSSSSSSASSPGDLISELRAAAANLSSSLMQSGRKTHTVHLPNGQSFQYCDEKSDLKCDDPNAICKLGACVCKPGFFSHRQAGTCQSISDLLKNCENDHQCQAFNVDLICDTQSHDKPFCDCPEGDYFDQETHTCLPCHRNTLILTGSLYDSLLHLDSATSAPSLASAGSNKTSANLDANSTATLSNSTTSSMMPTTSTTTPTTPIHQKDKGAPQLRPCKAGMSDLLRANHRRFQQLAVGQVGLHHFDITARTSTIAPPSIIHQPSSTLNQNNQSDPFRLKTPLEVFMGAIMLFTLITVAWFFFQRMVHDCRAIMRSLRNPDAGNYTTNGSDLTYTDPITGSRVINHHYLDPTSQAVARLFSGDAYPTPLSTMMSPRDFAGVMVQHLATSLSPSSTNNTLTANGAQSRPQSDHEAALYPITSSVQQSRNAAAAAAAQLLLSPSHPAIAILRAAAGQGPQEYTPVSFLNSVLDPPPKYEEAIAQSQPINTTQSVYETNNNNSNSQQTETTSPSADIAAAAPEVETPSPVDETNVNNEPPPDDSEDDDDDTNATTTPVNPHTPEESEQ